MTRLAYTPARSPVWTRRLLGWLGRTMGARVSRLDKSEALRLAIQAHRAPSARGWAYADAVLVHDVWLVVLERPAAAHIVEVDAYTGHAQSLASCIRPRRILRYRRTHRTVLISCSGWRGDPVVRSTRHRDGLCGKAAPRL